MTEWSRAATSAEQPRWKQTWSRKPFHPQTGPVSPLEWAPRKVSDTPVYDALERQWLAEGREVPRRPSLPPGGLHRMDTGVLFHHA